MRPTLLILATAILSTSCDKITSMIPGADKKKAELTISKEELAESDAAVADYIELIEKIPPILARVHNEKSAFSARKKIDLIAIDAAEAISRTKRVSEEDMSKVKGTPAKKPAGKKPTTNSSSAPKIDTTVYWYVHDRHHQGYKGRSDKVGRQIVSQILRIERITRESPVTLDVVVSGLMTIFEMEVNGVKKPTLKPGEIKPGIQPMSKEWLPPGVTPRKKSR